MSLTSGAATYLRFKCEGDLPKNLKDTAVERLAKHAFREINPKTNPETSTGWVNAFNPTDTHLNLEKILFGKYIVLGVRRDKKSLPTALFKARVVEALRAASREKHGRKLARHETAIVKENVKEKMLAETSPTIALFEAVWNYESGDVFFSSQSATPAAEFADLFKETFGLIVAEMSLASRCEAFAGAKGLDDELTALEPAHFGS